MAMLKKLVIIPGGFHPFHAGHKALYDAAVAQFPKADVFIAATDDKSTRPFPFKLKKTLAGIAGIPAHRFVQVKSPFQPREITDLYDPETTQLIFIRSDKDSGVAPLPGGFKKDGSASYLQPLKRNKPENMKQHGFMTYLPTVQFGPGMTSATEIRGKWPGMSAEEKEDLIVNLYPMTSKPMIDKTIEIFDTVLAEEKQALSMALGSIKKDIEEDKKCGSGEYYCRQAEKCMPIPKGYHVMPDGELMKDSEHKVKETKIIQKDNEVSILPAGGMGSHSEESIKSNLADKLRTLAEMLEDENYDNLEYVIYKSGAMESLVSALRQYQSFKRKRGNRPIKKDVEIDISNESGFSKTTEGWFSSTPEEKAAKQAKRDQYYIDRIIKDIDDMINDIEQRAEVSRNAWGDITSDYLGLISDEIFLSVEDEIKSVNKEIIHWPKPDAFSISNISRSPSPEKSDRLVFLLNRLKNGIIQSGKNEIAKVTEVQDYLPEDEMVVEYVFQSRPLRVLDNIARRDDVKKFPIKFDDGTQVEVTPKMAKKFMEIYLRKDADIQKLIDKKITQKEVFVRTFNDLIKGKRTTGLTVGDIR